MELRILVALIVAFYLFIRCAANMNRVMNGDRSVAAVGWSLLGLVLLGVGTGEVVASIVIWVTRNI